MKYPKLLASLTLIAAAIASSGAQAAFTYDIPGDFYDVGTLSAMNSIDSINVLRTSILPLSFSFSDTFKFTINNASDVYASVTDTEISMNHITFLNINGLNLDMVSTNFTDLGVDSYALNLAPGTYWATVTGNATGVLGGSYSVAMHATPAPVPVPTAVWLLGSGLLGLVGVARRKA